MARYCAACLLFKSRISDGERRTGGCGREPGDGPRPREPAPSCPGKRWTLSRQVGASKKAAAGSGARSLATGLARAFGRRGAVGVIGVARGLREDVVVEGRGDDGRRCEI